MPTKAKEKQAKKGTKAKSAKEGRPAPAKQKARAKPKGKEKKTVDLAALKANVAEAKRGLTRAQNEASALRAQTKGTEAVAKKAYIAALAPYREACREAGIECEFAGGRAANKTPAVRFLVEKVKNGVKVVLKGKPETEQVIPDAALKESIGKAAVAYVEEFIGDSATVGNKQGSLGNRLRAVLAKK